MVGDGRTLTPVRRDVVVLDIVLLNSESESCTLYDVLCVPELSYNLISVAKVSQKGKIVKFTRKACYILDKRHKMVAKGAKIGSLYQLNCKPNCELANVSTQKGIFWHKRFGRLVSRH